MKRLKGAFCPKCKEKLYRKMSIKRNNPKSTKCNYCGFKIENTHEVFIPRRKK